MSKKTKFSESGDPARQFADAVSSFELARSSLIAFMNQNASVLETRDLLVRAYNETLKEAKAIYRQNYEALGMRNGEFHVTVKMDVNAKKLIELMPNAEGAIEVKYVVNREEYNSLVKAGLIPSEVVQEVESVGSVSVYGPKEA